MMGEGIIEFTEHAKIIKNPGSLDGFGNDVRGVITSSWDLYLETISHGSIHNDILRVLYDHQVLEGTFSKKWTKQTPDNSGFLTVQRYEDTNWICIGESNRPLYRKDDYQVHLHLYCPFLQQAGLKNPSIKFIDKLIRIKGIFQGDEEFVTIRGGFNRYIRTGKLLNIIAGIIFNICNITIKKHFMKIREFQL
jgi:hypothetical protein